MVFKILCLTLLACALVQAAPPVNPDASSHPKDSLTDLGTAIANALGDFKNSLRDHLHAILNAKKNFVDGLLGEGSDGPSGERRAHGKTRNPDFYG